MVSINHPYLRTSVDPSSSPATYSRTNIISHTDRKDTDNTPNTQTIDTSPCHLTTMAAELRNNIYIFTLTLPEPLSIRLHNPDTITLPPEQTSHLGTSLLRTCRLINTEATPILYSLNKISFHQAPYLPPTLEALSAGAQHIRTIELSHMTESEVDELVKFTPRFEALQTIVIHESCCRYTHDPIWIVQRLGPLVAVLHKRFRQRGGKTAMEILQLPTKGEDGKWWIQVEEAMLEMVEFIDATIRNGGRMSNFGGWE
ncbi:hypothetical protein DOTSEDRAFT_82613 [Dothistroma septosporum NZE10]|uniref:Uncharacterized protein n=1 Tax=Dothistroma septosporum (strain NZE10 / CBS 128990) TaxID=675120 RepID=N1PBV4_DOTSN|nr:hypothetical protein DOTSEDRAFT_82613 [Dothistroma septosporum NZE10]